MTVFDGFDDLEDLKKQFEIGDGDLHGYEILYAVYERGGYEGDAFVLLRKGEDLFRVDASHCSCNGLECTWQPQITTKKNLALELASSRMYWSKERLCKVVEILSGMGD